MKLVRLMAASAAFGGLWPLPVAGAMDTAAQQPCSFRAEAPWVRRALAAWERTSRDLLGATPSHLPWIVLYDRECVFHLAASGDAAPSGTAETPAALSFNGRRVPVRTGRNHEKVQLPDGRVIATEPAAFTSQYGSDRRPYIALALPSRWAVRRAGIYEMLYLQRLTSGVLIHELVHAFQIEGADKRIGHIQKGLPFTGGVDDGYLDRMFGGNAAFLASLEEERKLMNDVARNRRHEDRARAAQALADRIASRRARFYTQDAEALSILEDVFLTTEGLATFAQFRASQLDRFVLFEGPGESIAQKHGLALALLLKRLAGWRHFVTPWPCGVLSLLRGETDPCGID